MTAPTPAQVAAYDAGRRAYAEGQNSTAVRALYPDGSPERLLWLRGFVQCRAEARYPAPAEEES
jgi:hypothetical protein